MRLVSWNIQWGRGADGRVDLARIVRAARETGDFDVLCLQEVAVNFPSLPGNDDTDQVRSLSALLPGYTAHFGAGSDLPDGQGGRRLFGNLVLSRLPVRQVFRHLLPWPADPCQPSMQRVAVEAVVQAPFGDLRVVTTHLEYYSEMCRMAQVEGLRELHRQAFWQAMTPRPDKGADGPFASLPRPASALFCGDFNFPAGAPEHLLMQSAFWDGIPVLQDAWHFAHPGVPHADTVGLHGAEWPDHRYCCDFAFVTEDLARRVSRMEVNQATDASDHQPILLELAD